MEKIRLNEILDNLKFNKIYLHFIEQYAIGVPLPKIKQNLNVDTVEKLARLKEDIKNMFDVNNDLDIIKIAYDLNIVTINDDLNKNWRDYAFRIAYNIYLCRYVNNDKEISLKLIYISVLRLCVTILR